MQKDYSGNAVWNSSTGSDQFELGTCDDGYKGNPIRICYFNGTWSNEILNACISDDVKNNKKYQKTKQNKTKQTKQQKQEKPQVNRKRNQLRCPATGNHCRT